MDDNIDLREWCLSCNQVVIPIHKDYYDRTEVVCPECDKIMDIIWRDNEYEDW